MKKIALIINLFFAVAVLTACSSATKDKTEKVKTEKVKAERMLVITSAEPAKVLPAFTTFTWDDSYSAVLSATTHNQKGAVKAYIREQLIAYLKTKGYRYEPIAMQADVVVGFLFALEDTVADKSMKDRFGILPTNKPTARPIYKQGTLLLTVLDSQLEKAYWRSALLGFVDLEDLLDAPDQERMQVILDSMMGGFPKAGR